MMRIRAAIASLAALPTLALAQLPPNPSGAHPAAVSEAGLESGHALYRKGRNCIWTGTALLPLGLLALVPVMYDGAFGITAADPAIGGTVLAVGGGLIHAGIPLLGSGAEREALAVERLRSGFRPDTGGWSSYRRSWRHLALGGGMILAAYPFVLVGGLQWDEANFIDYTALALLSGGAVFVGVGMLEQYYSGYRFMESHRRNHNALAAPVSLSLQPLLRMGSRGGFAGGVALRGEF